MKILLTILLFLISSTVYGNENLSGYKIVCNEEIDNGIILIGFEFTSPKTVHVYQETNTTPQRIVYMNYKTSTSAIDIKVGTSLYYKISRKNLEVRSSTKLLYYSSECELWDDSVDAYFNKKLKKFKVGNLL